MDKYITHTLVFVNVVLVLTGGYLLTTINYIAEIKYMYWAIKTIWLFVMLIAIYSLVSIAIDHKNKKSPIKNANNDEG